MKSHRLDFTTEDPGARCWGETCSLREVEKAPSWPSSSADFLLCFPREALFLHDVSKTPPTERPSFCFLCVSLSVVFLTSSYSVSFPTFTPWQQSLALPLDLWLTFFFCKPGSLGVHSVTKYPATPYCIFYCQRLLSVASLRVSIAVINIMTESSVRRGTGLFPFTGHRPW